ncbi:unnamed protein product [Ilex paraguariensis]|uniref:Uncharacterized protein n=1 Tax=Ilex paraguariensis TaxID=185542 RepID=A0ABC8SQQ3_9AQUA
MENLRRIIEMFDYDQWAQFPPSQQKGGESCSQGERKLQRLSDVEEVHVEGNDLHERKGPKAMALVLRQKKGSSSNAKSDCIVFMEGQTAQSLLPQGETKQVACISDQTEFGDYHTTIDKLRESRTAVSSADIANDFTLGVPGEAFAFTQCDNKVTVAEASGLTGDISQLEQFIMEHVKF